MKKISAALVAVLLGIGMLAGCTPTSSSTPASTPDASASTPATGDSSTPDASGAGGTTMAANQDIMVCFASDPETIDPALNSSVDGSTLLNNSFAGLYGWADKGDGTLGIVADCAEAVVTPTQTDDGKYEYVIKVKDGLKWSDGEPLMASDFVYSWNRAVDPATLADYQYIFDVIDGYDAEAPALNIAADDEANTVTIVTNALVPYFDQLMAFPTYYPVRQDIVEADPDGWATDPATYISNGPFRMTEWTVGSSIVYEKNPNYWDADNVKLNTLTFALSADDDANYVNFDNGTYQLIYNVPQQMIPEFKETRLGTDFFIGDYIGTYYIEFNVEKSLKPGLTSAGDTAEDWADWTPQQNAEVRHALGLLVDRNYLVDEVMMSGEVAADGFVPAKMDDGTGTEFRSKAGNWWSTDPADQEANIEEALTILKQYYDYDEATGMFTNFPTFEFSMNANTRNTMIVSAVQDMWKDYGINPSIDQRDWAVIQTALTQGDFTASRLGWIADYDDPIVFLEIFVTASGNNHPRLGKDGAVGSAAVYGPERNQTWADAYDALIAQIKSEADPQVRADMMYQAEAILQDAWPMIPLFYYTNPYMCSVDLQDIMYSPLGWINFKFSYMTEAA